MKREFICIADGKLYICRDGKPEEMRSGVLEAYLHQVRDSAQRNEWKTSGEGAKFREAYVPGADAESRVAAVSSRIHCAAADGDALLYSLSIDRTTGIYRRTEDSPSEGIVISSGDYAYREFDVYRGRMAVSASFAGESHIGVMPMGTTDCVIYTEGHCWDSRPVWSRTHPSRIYYCSAGLPENTQQEESSRPPDMSQMVTQMFTAAAPVSKGPGAVMLLDTEAGTLDEVLADDRYDFLQPQSMPDGSLYYIRRPYRSEPGTNPLGCLGDLLLLPVRLLGALFGFLNVFTAKYSGKTLSRSTGTKHRDEGKMRIDGNLIDAEAELRANRSRGEENPGIIPHSWELRCLRPNGEDVLIHRGVLSYCADEETGAILLSNGSAVLALTPDGKEEKLLDFPRISFLRSL